MTTAIRLPHLLALFFFFISSALASAQDFIRIDWSKMKIDSVLPTFVTSLKAAHTDIGDRPSVVVEYPEWQELSDTERKAVIRTGIPVSQDLQIETVRSVSRKQESLAVSFCPIIRRDKKYYKLVSCRIRPAATAATRALSLSAQPAAGSRYTGKSVLAEGRWVKIRVDKEGIYQLTPSQLSSMGFKNPDNVRLFGYGGRIQSEVIDYTSATPDYDDLEEVPMLKDGSRRLFFAEGVVRWSAPAYNTSMRDYLSEHTNNPYSRYSYYFLTEGEPMDFPQEEYSATSDTPLTTFPEHAVYEEDAFCWYTSGRKLYDSHDFASSNSKTYAIATPGLVADRQASVRIAFSASNISSTSVQVDINQAENVRRFSIRKLSSYERAVDMTQTFRTSALTDAAPNTVRITTTAGQNARLDYITINYWRNLSLEGSSLLFTHHLSGRQTFELGHADAQTRVWRIGYAGSPTAEIRGTLSGSTYKIPVADATQRYIAFDSKATYPSPHYVEAVANQNLHEDKPYDMVIIVPKSGKLTAQAQRLAEAHADKDRLRVKVVRADEIYNEFSSGTPDMTAYRRYMKMLYDRAGSEADMPRYLLFFGDAAWDNRMLTPSWRAYNPDDFLLCYESVNSVYEVDSYVTDDYAGFLDDGESSRMESNSIDLGIGRFPVRTEAEAKIIVDKTLAYMANTHAGAWQNTICMMGDDGDNNGHMGDAETVTAALERTYPDLVLKRFYWDAYERTSAPTGNTYPQIAKALKEQVGKGALVMNYSGHGAPATISPERVLVLSDFENFSSDNLPLWVTASCEITPFDMQEETIGETAVLSERGAAIAFMSASRAVYATPNRNLNQLFMKYVLGTDEQGNRNTMGDAMRLTKASLMSGIDGLYDSSLNKLKYALMGDPALALNFPLHRVTVDSIDGRSVSDGIKKELKAGSIVTVAGHIETKAGEKITSFDGSVTLTVRGIKEKITCRNNPGDADTLFTYTDRPVTIFEGNDSVVNGTYRITFRLPIDITYTEQTGLINLYAVNKEHTHTASGHYEDFCVAGPDANFSPDGAGPSIYIYLNDPEFKNGGKVNDTPYFVALLSDDDGINISGNGVGHDLELIIDGKETTSYVLNNYYTNDFGSYVSGRVGFSIPALSDGKHTLLFRAWDMNNNSSARALDFVVEKGLKPALTELKCTPNPARTRTTIQMTYNRPENNVSFHIDIYDTMGRHVWSNTLRDVTSNGYYSTTWNLDTAAGGRVAAGLYFVRVQVEEGGGKSAVLTDKIIVLGQ